MQQIRWSHKRRSYSRIFLSCSFRIFLDRRGTRWPHQLGRHFPLPLEGLVFFFIFENSSSYFFFSFYLLPFFLLLLSFWSFFCLDGLPSPWFPGLGLLELLESEYSQWDLKDNRTYWSPASDEELSRLGKQAMNILNFIIKSVKLYSAYRTLGNRSKGWCLTILW